MHFSNYIEIFDGICTSVTSVCVHVWMYLHVDLYMLHISTWMWVYAYSWLCLYDYGDFYQCTTSALGSCWLDAKLLGMSGVFVGQSIAHPGEFNGPWKTWVCHTWWYAWRIHEWSFSRGKLAVLHHFFTLAILYVWCWLQYMSFGQWFYGALTSVVGIISGTALVNDGA